jgi:hypothetical protein
VLLDNDDHGTHLVTPDQYSDARTTAVKHYGEVNPDSYTELGKNLDGTHGSVISFDIAPSHILTQSELDTWINDDCAKTGKGWWWYDLLFITYRNLEHKAQMHSAEDPERAQEELKAKQETAKIAAPSDAAIQRLASRRIYYTNKVFTTGRWSELAFRNQRSQFGSRDWLSGASGSSEQTIISEAYKAAVTYSSVTIDGKRSISEDQQQCSLWLPRLFCSTLWYQQFLLRRPLTVQDYTSAPQGKHIEPLIDGLIR